MPIARWLEDGFNVTYLVTIWVVAVSMLRRQGSVASVARPLAFHFAVAFFLLAVGDTFHLGLRILSSLGSGELQVGGQPMSLVGLGMMVTAYTMTGFYILLADARRARRGGRDGWFWLMQTLLSTRLVLMALPGNAWGASVAPWGMGVTRNLPLAVAGTALAILMVREGKPDRTWRRVGWAMLVSFACYVPVILFVVVPPLGLLMIPKTVAYVVMALVAWRGYFTRNEARVASPGPGQPAMVGREP